MMPEMGPVCRSTPECRELGTAWCTVSTVSTDSYARVGNHLQSSFDHVAQLHFLQQAVVFVNLSLTSNLVL
jgi:hypothetical protein